MNYYPYSPLGNGYAPPYLMNQPIYNPVPQQPISTGPHMEIQSVNGKESAYAFPMGPNSSVILVDNLAPKIWFVTTDSSGYKAVTGFKIVQDEEEEPVHAEGKVEDPIKAINERLLKLEERMNSYGQPNNKPSYQSKSGNGGSQPNDRSGAGGRGSYGGGQSNGSD